MGFLDKLLGRGKKAMGSMKGSSSSSPQQGAGGMQDRPASSMGQEQRDKPAQPGEQERMP